MHPMTWTDAIGLVIVVVLALLGSELFRRG